MLIISFNYYELILREITELVDIINDKLVPHFKCYYHNMIINV